MGRWIWVRLEFAGSSTPFARINVGNGLGETPVVRGEVLDIVLPLAVQEVSWLP